MEIRNKAGMVFQNPDNQIVATIVEEDVAFGAGELGIEPWKSEKELMNIKKVDMYRIQKTCPTSSIRRSKTKSSYCRDIAMMPECIVFDEPTAMLDPSGRKEVMRTIKDLNKNYGITIVLYNP